MCSKIFGKFKRKLLIDSIFSKAVDYRHLTLQIKMEPVLELCSALETNVILTL